MKKRQTISDYAESLLKAEIVNRCPICGSFEETMDTFTNHHIDGDPSVSDYWNLIRICSPCHERINKEKEDGKKLRKIKQIKKDLFRKLIGDASYQVLLMANKHKITSTLPCLSVTLLNLGLIEVENPNPFTVGTANHATIMDFRITEQGKVFIERLNMSENVPV
ncbi:MAG: HNH endonuclease signature motif containing protein [Thermodesulfobacteriota bacterium]|jgi:hypothetical protein